MIEHRPAPQLAPALLDALAPACLVWVPAVCPPPDATVIIRFYNGRREWLDRAVETVLGPGDQQMTQMSADIRKQSDLSVSSASSVDSPAISVEVIVVDDGSDRPLAPFADPRVGFLRLPCNQGLGAARNEGVRRARGRWVTMLDYDDERIPGSLAEQIAAGEGAGATLVFAGLEVLDVLGAGDRQREHLRRAWDGRHETLRDLVLDYHNRQGHPENLVPCGSLMWRRERFDVAAPPDYISCDDYAVVQQMLLDARPEEVLFLDKPVYRYRAVSPTSDRGSSAADCLPGGVERRKITEYCISKTPGLVRYHRLVAALPSVGADGPAVGAGSPRPSAAEAEGRGDPAPTTRRPNPPAWPATTGGRPLRVVFVERELGMGGAQWQIALLATHAEPRALDVRILCETHSPLATWLGQRGRFVRVKPADADWLPWLDAQLAELQPDALDGSWYPHAARFVAQPPCPVYLHAAGMQAMWERQDWGASRKIDWFLCESEAVARAHPEWGERRVVIPNAVDVEAFRASEHRRPGVRAALGLPDDAVVVSFCGRMTAGEKRTPVLRQVLARLAQERPHVWWLVAGHFAGHVPNQAALVSNWEGFIAGKPVRWLGEMQPWQAPAFHAAADVNFCCSSSEGLSLATLEAMAAGCVVVTSDAGGQREAVVPGTGWVVAVADTEGLYQALLRAVDLPAGERRAMGRFARFVCAGRFHIAENVRRHVLAYAARARRDVPTAAR
ncbi:MAG: glycosyltransferase [Armatimonadetes bacterium]|nr:glycosyltransferase [Armatimonadota bacterium]